MVSPTSLLVARHLEDVMENKPESSLVVFLGKTRNGTPPPLCGKQVAQFSFRKELVAGRASNRKTNAK